MQAVQSHLAGVPLGSPCAMPSLSCKLMPSPIKLLEVELTSSWGNSGHSWRAPTRLQRAVPSASRSTPARARCHACSVCLLPPAATQAAVQPSAASGSLFPSEVFASCQSGGYLESVHVLPLPLCSLSIYYVPGPVPGAWDSATNKIG